MNLPKMKTNMIKSHTAKSGPNFDNWVRRLMTWSPSVLTTEELTMISENRERLDSHPRKINSEIELKGKHWCEHNKGRK